MGKNNCIGAGVIWSIIAFMSIALNSDVATIGLFAISQLWFMTASLHKGNK